MYLVAVDVFVVLAYFGEKALCGTQHTDAVSSTALRRRTAGSGTAESSTAVGASNTSAQQRCRRHAAAAQHQSTRQ